MSDKKTLNGIEITDDMTKIYEKDLNAVFHMNSSISQQMDGFRELGLTGDISKALRGLGWFDDSFVDGFKNGINSWIEILTFWNMWKDADSFIANSWEYKNIINDYTKWEFESLLLENGKIAIVRENNVIVPILFVVEEWEFLTKRPTKIKSINSFNDNSKTDGKEYTEFVIIRNDPWERTTIIKTIRYIREMLNILYQIERNILTAQNKLIINPNGATLNTTDNNSTKDSWNEIITGDNVVYTIEQPFSAGSRNSWNKPDGRVLDGNITIKEDFIYNIALVDRTKELIENFLFTKDLFKESIGASPNSMNKKAERVNVMEMDTQQDLSKANLDTMFKCRKDGIERMNKLFGTNMQIIMNVEEQKEEKEIEDKEDE